MMFVRAYLLLGAFTGTLALLVVLSTLSKRAIASMYAPRMVIGGFFLWPYCWYVIAQAVVRGIKNVR
jgi:hypothetical protein